MLPSLESSEALVFTHIFTSGRENGLKCYRLGSDKFGQNAADDVVGKVALCARERKVNGTIVGLFFC